MMKKVTVVDPNKKYVTDTGTPIDRVMSSTFTMNLGESTSLAGAWVWVAGIEEPFYLPLMRLVEVEEDAESESIDTVI